VLDTWASSCFGRSPRWAGRTRLRWTRLVLIFLLSDDDPSSPLPISSFSVVADADDHGPVSNSSGPANRWNGASRSGTCISRASSAISRAARCRSRSQLARSARPDRKIRCRWPPLRHHLDCAAGAGHPVCRGTHRILVRISATSYGTPCRFPPAQRRAGDSESLSAIIGRLDPDRFDADDHAILDRLLAVTREVDRCFYEFEFSATVQALYGFFWNDFCDWYVEVSKPSCRWPIRRPTALRSRTSCSGKRCCCCIRFIPFITEELWNQLGFGAAGTFLTRDARLVDASALVETLHQSLDFAGKAPGAKGRGLQGICRGHPPA